MLILIQRAIFYTFSIGTEALISAALLPILTSKLAPADYGVWVLLIAASAFFRPFLQLMFPDVLKMKFFQFSKGEISGIITAGIIMPLILASLILAINKLTNNFFSNLLEFNNWELSIILLFAMLHGFYYLILALLQFNEKPKLFLGQQILQTVITITLTLILLQYEASWRAPLIARVIALSFNSLLGLIWIRHVYHRIWNFEQLGLLLKKIIAPGIRLLPAGLAVMIVPLTDRLMVSKMINVQETSFLGIGALFSLVVSIFVAGLIHAWQPSLYKEMNAAGSTENIHHYSRMYFLIIPVIGFIFCVIGILIAPLMMSYDINQVKPYIIAFTCAAVVDGFYQHNYTILKGMQRTGLLAAFSILLIVSNILFDALLIKSIGGIGSAWGTTLAYILITIASSFFLIKKARSNEQHAKDRSGSL